MRNALMAAQPSSKGERVSPFPSPPTTPKSAAGDPVGDGTRVTKVNKETLARYRAASQRIKELKQRRSALNADINAERKRLVAAGLSLQAFKDLEAWLDMDEVKRELYDETAAVVRVANGLAPASKIILPPDDEIEELQEQFAFDSPPPAAALPPDGE